MAGDAALVRSARSWASPGLGKRLGGGLLDAAPQPLDQVDHLGGMWALRRGDPVCLGSRGLEKITDVVGVRVVVLVGAHGPASDSISWTAMSSCLLWTCVPSGRSASSWCGSRTSSAKRNVDSLNPAALARRMAATYSFSRLTNEAMPARLVRANASSSSR